MERVKIQLNVFFRTYKTAFAVWAIILIGYALLSVFLINISHKQFLSHLLTLEFWAIAICGVITTIFYQHTRMIPYFISMGVSRINCFKETIVRNIIMALIFSVFITLAFLTEYLAFGYGHIAMFYLGLSFFDVNVSALMQITLIQFCILICVFGTFTLVASILGKHGILYGMTALFLVLSVIILFNYYIAVLISFGYPLIYSCLIPLGIGIISNLASWKFIRYSETV